MKPDVAQKTQNIRSLKVHGGGGTDMRIGIAAALESKPKPNIIVLFTDGYTEWPEQPLPGGVRLVVCLVGEHSCDVNTPPAWATVVKIVGDDIETRTAA
jgi:predicted metal-dependent peptidase